MDLPERSLDRRPVLPMRFTPRVGRSEKLWRRILLYYVRHAERVWRRPDLRANVQRELGRAKTQMTVCLAVLGDDQMAGYSDEAAVSTLDLEARFPEVIHYVELFEMADRLYWALEHDDVAGLPSRTERRRIRAEVSHALRSPAQVVADTPALHATTAQQEVPVIAF